MSWFETPKSLIPWWVILVTIIVCSFSLTAQAHPLHELDDWYEDWTTRWETLGGVTPDLIAELSDMMDRHPGYEPPEYREIAEDRTGGTQTSPSNTYSGMGSNVEQWRGLVAGYFSDVDKALCVIEHESGGNPNAYNPSTASGLFQVKTFWFDAYGGDPFDPANNARVAALVLAEQGWGAWAVVNKGLC